MNLLVTTTIILSVCFLSSCSTISDYRGDPSTWGETDEQKQMRLVEKFTMLLGPKPIITSKPTIENSYSRNSSSNAVSKNTMNGRTVLGMIEPKNVTNLPDNKDLQESTNITPAPAPVAPVLEKISPPIVPVQPEVVPADIPQILDPNSALPPSKE